MAVVQHSAVPGEQKAASVDRCFAHVRQQLILVVGTGERRCGGQHGPPFGFLDGTPRELPWDVALCVGHVEPRFHTNADGTTAQPAHSTITPRAVICHGATRTVVLQ